MRAQAVWRTAGTGRSYAGKSLHGNGNRSCVVSTPRNPIVRLTTTRPGLCCNCGAAIPVGVLYLERTRGRVCSDCTRSIFGLDLPLPPTPEEMVLARATKQPASAALAHLGDGCCWIWNGARSNSGYGKAVGRSSSNAHRWSYSLLVGPIPQGLHLDHLCKIKSCVAPHHLEPVTPAENFDRSRSDHAAAVAKRRMTHCKYGHEYTPENTITHAKGRKCRTCHRRINLASWYRRQGRGAA